MAALHGQQPARLRDGTMTQCHLALRLLHDGYYTSLDSTSAEHVHDKFQGHRHVERCAKPCGRATHSVVPMQLSARHRHPEEVRMCRVRCAQPRAEQPLPQQQVMDAVQVVGVIPVPATCTAQEERRACVDRVCQLTDRPWLLRHRHLLVYAWSPCSHHSGSIDGCKCPAAQKHVHRQDTA